MMKFIDFAWQTEYKYIGKAMRALGLEEMAMKCDFIADGILPDESWKLFYRVSVVSHYFLFFFLVGAGLWKLNHI